MKPSDWLRVDLSIAGRSGLPGYGLTWVLVGQGTSWLETRVLTRHLVIRIKVLFKLSGLLNRKQLVFYIIHTIGSFSMTRISLSFFVCLWAVKKATADPTRPPPTITRSVDRGMSASGESTLDIDSLKYFFKSL